MLDYALILSTHYAGKQWTLNGNSYGGLTWLDSSPKPTQDELDALWESTKAAVATKNQAALAVKESALAKLSAIGLTEAEIKALIG
jgi:hypothetical protein